MCGIAGAVGDLDPGILEAVARASEAQHHRGPDAEGFWREPAERTRICLAHRRLAIIDLSEGARQPMTDLETGNVLCYNGEVYNFRALRTELEHAGARFRTESDTEVILKAYAQWGRDAVLRLRGMFAFALWDARSGRTLLARDRLGIKPLYLTEVARPGGRSVVLFASEVRALLASGLVEARLCPSALSGYLWNGFVNGDGAIVRGVRALPAGSWLELDAGAPAGAPKRYWSLPPARPAKPGMDGVLAVKDALYEAVALRMVADVPIGVFLSGGIDSSAVAALAARSGARVCTFNVAFEEAAYDESFHARRVANALGAEHTEIPLSRAGFSDQLDDALGSLDQPTFDAVNTYAVSRAVRQAGITVALAGTGGDELFGGYRSFVDLPRAARLAASLRALPEALLRRAAARFAAGRGFPPQTRWGKLADVLATRGRLPDLYQVSYALFTREFLARLAIELPNEPEWVGVAPERYAEFEALAARPPQLQAISDLELRSFVGERLLPDTDCTSMASSLEVRVPLLDHEVIEAAAGLNETRRYRPLGTKRVLRDLGLEDLPATLFHRPKMGFELPLEAWLRDALAPAISARFASREACEAVGVDVGAVAELWSAYRAGTPGLYWSRVWALFVLLDWSQRHSASL